MNLKTIFAPHKTSQGRLDYLSVLYQIKFTKARLFLCQVRICFRWSRGDHTGLQQEAGLPEINQIQ